MTPDNQSLPPLPERVAFWPYVQTDGFTLGIVQAYGDARAAHARKMALEDAAKVCESRSLSLSHGNQFSQSNEAHKCGSAIRSLI